MGVTRPAATIGEFEVTPLTNGKFKENCYLVVHQRSGDCVVVDPGSEAEFLVGELDARGLRPQKLLLTHGHFDHIGAVDALMTRYAIACEVHVREERLVRQAGTYAFRFAREPLRVPRGLTFFNGDEPLGWNGRAIDVIPTPGHTSGSVALALGGAFVFTGDTLFRERIGPTTYPESDPEAILLSVRALLEALPAQCVIFPGHGRPWTIGDAQAWWRDLRGPAPAQAIF
jgi:glyoxylase-like metal-dependent hydrolase (beta-lactamase superfamily II)